MIPPVAALDTWLRESEQTLGVDREVQKLIRWRRTGQPDRSDVSLAYVHGYSASRQETAPLADQVAEALDANLYYTRLRGHGLDGEALLDVELEHWMNDVQQSFEIARRIGERQIVLASSTGATLVALAAAENRLPDSILGFVFMSPNYGPADRRAEFITLPAGKSLARMLVGEWRGHERVNEAHARFWTVPSPTYALIPMMQAVKQLRELLEAATIRTPTLTLYNTADTVIQPELVEQTAPRFVHELSRTQIVSTTEDPAGHILAGDILSPGTTGTIRDMIVEFARELLDT